MISRKQMGCRYGVLIKYKEYKDGQDCMRRANGGAAEARGWTTSRTL